MKRFLGLHLSPNILLILLLAAWWVVNLLQASFTELSNDEAYYFMFSRNLAWGYFDHPPITALLVRMGALFGGELGVRLFFTTLQPLYLLMLWYLVRPSQSSNADVKLFVVIAAAIPMLQLYGFIAVPDAPLLFCSALFFLFYKRFVERNTIVNAILLGFAVALLAYSKYHGALVVMFTLLSNIRLFKNSKLYLAAIVAVVLLLPHVLWQYQNDWVSFRYHLVGRNGRFEISYVTEYILNIFAVFNPLFFPLYIKAWIKSKSSDLTIRAIYFVSLGMIVFFLLSSVRGYVQPQWVIPAAFGFIALLFTYVRNHHRSRRYTMVAGCVTISLVVLVRLVMIFNPISIQYDIFDNKSSYGELAELAQGRSIVFGGYYPVAAKYNFYTGGRAFSQPDINYRSSQWQLEENDTEMAGEQVLMEVDPSCADTTITLANERSYNFRVVNNFHPTRKVSVSHGDLPACVWPGQVLNLDVELHNPYSYDVEISPDSIQLAMAWGLPRNRYNLYALESQLTLRAGQTVNINVDCQVPQELERGKYRVGFVINAPFIGHWFADRQTIINVE